MLTILLKALLLPPGLQIILIIVGLLVWRWCRWLSKSCLWIGMLSLWLLSLPVVSALLHQPLEAPFIKVSAYEGNQAQAVVVLGAGRHYAAPEYGDDTLSHSALWRLRYGAYLAKRWDLPVVVSGGSVRDFDRISEAEMAANFLTEEMGVETVWLEKQSRNTWQNALYSKNLLDEKSIEKVFLVTHAYHMQRSAYAFKRAGIEYIPMPTGFSSNQAVAAWWRHWLPASTALQRSYLALHEYLGLLFYRMK